jgi:hypothetical protein
MPRFFPIFVRFSLTFVLAILLIVADSSASDEKPAQVIAEGTSMTAQLPQAVLAEMLDIRIGFQSAVLLPPGSEERLAAYANILDASDRVLKTHPDIIPLHFVRGHIAMELLLPRLAWDAAHHLKSAPADQRTDSVNALLARLDNLGWAGEQPPGVVLIAGSPPPPAELQSLASQLVELAKSPPEKQNTLGQPLLDAAKKLALQNPDSIPCWLLQAQVCLILNNSLHGRVAGSHLVELRAWVDAPPPYFPALLKLVASGWMSSPGLNEDDQRLLADLSTEALVMPEDAYKQPSAAKLMSRIKAFNKEHLQQPMGWLLQAYFARQLNRPLDESIALKQIPIGLPAKP